MSLQTSTIVLFVVAALLAVWAVILTFSLALLHSDLSDSMSEVRSNQESLNHSMLTLEKRVNDVELENDYLFEEQDAEGMALKGLKVSNDPLNSLSLSISSECGQKPILVLWFSFLPNLPKHCKNAWHAHYPFAAKAKKVWSGLLCAFGASFGYEWHFLL